MNFIDDDEIETIPELIHVPVCTLERGDRQRRPPAHAIAIAPDRAPVQSPDLPEPLIEQYPRRNQTQGAQPRPVHGGERQPGLAAPSRESDDATAVPQLPRGQCRLLIGSEVDVRPRLVRRPCGRRDVLKSAASVQKPALQGGILTGWRPMGVDPSIPTDAWRPDEVQLLRRIGQHDRPTIESQLHTQRVSGRIFGLSGGVCCTLAFDTRESRPVPMPKDGYVCGLGSLEARRRCQGRVRLSTRWRWRPLDGHVPVGRRAQGREG